MAKKADLRQYAEGMFVDLGHTAKAIAEQFDLTEQTVGRWRKDGEWDRKRDELLASPYMVRQILLKEIQNLANGGKATIDSDALSKVSKVMESFNSKVSPQLAISVIKMLDDFYAETNPEQASSNLDIHKKFILHIINLHG